MQIKRYEARNMQEAIEQIKRELGSEAIILSNKQIGTDKNPLVEVVAAKDNGQHGSPPFPYEQSIEAAPLALSSAPHFEESDWDILKGDIDELKGLFKEFQKRDHMLDDIDDLKDRLNVLFDLMGLRQDGKQGPLAPVYAKLVAHGISRKSACVLLEMLSREIMTDRIETPEEGLKRIEDLIRDRFEQKQSFHGGSRIKVFVGPTGVGKTTTIAKLAALYSLEDKKRVGLATTDTYRIAAPEQLKTYARIMGIPVKIVSDKNHFHKMTEEFSDRDVILIDTPGTGLKDRGHFERLKEMFSQQEGVDIILLLGMSSSQENLYGILNRFESLRID
ncbi:MAG: flagellar biosynthesis protein FlhF, partial [Syntrophobacterales bacterium]|nr:flagellar biosynthesis protein FlhF [Syntrophobacterales bacterium]